MRVSSRAAELAVAGEPGEPAVRVGLAELAAQAAQEALAVRAGSAAPEDPAVPVALVVPENPAVQVASAVPEDPVVQVASVVPGDPVVRVVQESLAVPVALELGIVLGAVQLARGQVEAVPERDPVAVPPRIKLVIAVRHRDLVPRLVAVEDLAAAVETTRDPAAIEAATAWVAAV
jgi:hypothetical protein